MNKTININLAGLFFHIDEDAYNRLQKYLNAVRRSFSGTHGSEEIMSDIEARIAELFLEKRANELQVISIAHVEEVINIMGQPEDYEVDEDIFEESKSYKKNKDGAQPPFKRPLFRDTLNGYVGGISAGLGHFAGINPIWVRVLWVISLFPSGGFSILLYLLLWVIVKDAVTTNERLSMMGKEVNISNIGEKVQSGFDEVVDGQTDADYRIVGQKGKRGTVKFFSFLGRIIKGIFKAIAKIIGLLLFLTGVTALIALILGIIGLGTVQVQGNDFFRIIEYGIPESISLVWIYIITFLLAGIPMLVLAILGLKLLISNMNSVGRPVKIILLLLWIASVIGLCVIIANVGASHAFEGKETKTETLTIDQNKVFDISMVDSSYEGYDNVRINGNKMSINFDDDGVEDIKLFGIKTAIAASKDNIARVEITYLADGPNMATAKENASVIEYPITMTDSSIILPDYFTTSSKKINRQKIQVVIKLPEGTRFKWNDEFEYHYYSYINRDITFLESKDIDSDYIYEMRDEKAVCLDCPEKEKEKEEKEKEEDKSDENEWKYEDDDEKDKVTITKKVKVGALEIKTEETY